MSEKITGLVKWYNTRRGFGVISGSAGKEYFIHISNLPPDVRELSTGTRLLFDGVPRPYHNGGYEAVHIEMDKSPVQEPLPVIKSTPPKPQFVQSSPATSASDYWYQSYTGGIDTNAPSHSANLPLETKVVGVTYEGRQTVVALLEVGEEVLLVREPDNAYDNNAIKVTRKDGQDFGFLSRHLAARLAPDFDKYGQPVKATVISLTRGYYSDSNLGVTIKFKMPETPENDDCILKD